MVSGLPVTTAGTEYPFAIENVSMIHAIISGVVLTSGAGMSLSGPMTTMISVAYRRVRRSSSPLLSVFGSTMTPPFAPPYGRPARAHFHVIHMASARTSSSVTAGWKRIPPFVGPQAMLCCTR